MGAGMGAIGLAGEGLLVTSSSVYGVSFSIWEQKPLGCSGALRNPGMTSAWVIITPRQRSWEGTQPYLYKESSLALEGEGGLPRGPEGDPGEELQCEPAGQISGLTASAWLSLPGTTRTRLAEVRDRY